MFGVNGFASFPWKKPILGGSAVIGIVLSLVYNYRIGCPFGIDMNFTPTHLVDGERQPDTMSERKGIAIIQNDELVIHGTVQLSRFTDRFKLALQTSSEIEVELRTIPKKEHEYDPEKNIVQCKEVTEFEFPIIIEIFPKRGVAEGGRYHRLELVDMHSNRTLVEFDVLNVGY
ncbi:hypothetical protein [Natrinema sp. SYSU A 869]|uniref:hypothetical protein n=1 Tax=Natrinema sp. SYSU A 869 TaxID=2871694 RepID=UPI001CA3B7A2|nr:hypothetical protein [Natrinema sp. SYSU A 869]